MFKKKRSDKPKKKEKAAKGSPGQYDQIMIDLDSLSQEEFDAKFDHMMNEMNMRSNDVRSLMLLKSKPAKKDMIAKFLVSRGLNVNEEVTASKTTTSSKKKGLVTPSDYAAELTKKDLTHSYLLTVLSELKILLTTEPLGWTEEFLTTGMDSVFSLIDTIIRAPEFMTIKEMQDVVHECIRCVQAIMNSKGGFKFVLEKDEYLFILVKCIIPENNQLMTDVIRLLAAVSVVNIEKALWGLSYVAKEKKTERFLYIINGLDVNQPDVLQINCMVLLNALISGSEDIDLRVHLRNESIRLNILDKISKLKEKQHSGLQTQITIFEDAMENDACEIHGKFYEMQAHVSDINEAFEILKNINLKTPAETYLLSIFQHLLFIREDTLIRTQYYRLIEEVVSQIVLQKNGVDPDFSLQKLTLDVDSLIENMCNESLVIEAKDRMVVAEQNYKNELQQKTELSAKLAITVKDYTAKIKKIKKAYMVEKKAKEKLEQELGAGGGVKASEDTLNTVKATSDDSATTPESAKKIITPPPDKDAGLPIIPTPPVVDTPEAPGGAPPADVPPPPGGAPPAPADVPPPPGAAPPAPGGVPPPPGGVPPPPGGAPPAPGGAPPAPGGPPAPAAVFVNPKKKYAPSQTKRLNWSQLNSKSFEPGSIWKNMKEEELEKPELFAKLNDLFTAKKVAPAGGAAKNAADDKKKTKLPKVLDGKTVQNLSLFLGACKMTNEEIVKKIYSCDKSLLTENFVSNLIKYLPPFDQRCLLDDYKDHIDELPDAELFVMKLNVIKRLDGKLRCWEMMLKFPEILGDIKPNISSITSSCTELKHSTKFAELLKLILLIGNYMNAGSRNERTMGFDLHFLTKLGDTKTADNSMTFLHYLDETIREHYHDIIGFEGDLTSVPTAAKVSDEMIGRTVLKLEAAVNQAKKEVDLCRKTDGPEDKFVETVDKFLEDASSQVGIVQEMHNNMKEAFSTLSKYLTLDNCITTSEECFTIISSFLDEYNRAAGENRTRKERIEREARFKERKEADLKAKAQKTKALVGKETDDASKDTGVIDGLLTSLESGQAFNKKIVLKKKNNNSKVDYRKERTRTMGKNAKALFSAMMGEQAKEFDQMDL